METQAKLRILADSAKYDASCASSGSRRSGTKDGIGHSDGTGICHSYTPDGRCVSLLKILVTNYCVYDCLFCVNRVTSDVPRARFTPEEVVRLTLEFYKRNYIEGLFLSSGIIQSPDYTMEQLVAVARSLREEHKFNGYIHLKAIPGAAPELLLAAGRYADRLSANIELPTPADLEKLAPEKKSTVIDETMTEISSNVVAAKEERKVIKSAPAFAPAGQSTQFVVGATATQDGTILQRAASLYKRHKLRRIYYSGFSPFQNADARLPIAAPPLLREHRLYQADWLMRYYGFQAEQIVSADQNLDLQRDPKLAWALRNRLHFPVDVNKGTREQLLKIPGVGYRSVQRILSIRRYHLLSLADLRKLNVIVSRAKPFIVTTDHTPGASIDRLDLPERMPAPPQQLLLFDSQQSAIGGEL
jgi:putative DNA modification/repair radical SAM protein